MNRHFESQLRAIVLTDTDIFRLDPNDKFNSFKFNLSGLEID